MAPTACVFDDATGELVSSENSVQGPHPLDDGMDVCGITLAYLLGS